MKRKTTVQNVQANYFQVSKCSLSYRAFHFILSHGERVKFSVYLSSHIGDTICKYFVT